MMMLLKKSLKIAGNGGTNNTILRSWLGLAVFNYYSLSLKKNDETNGAKTPTKHKLSDFCYLYCFEMSFFCCPQLGMDDGYRWETYGNIPRPSDLKHFFFKINNRRLCRQGTINKKWPKKWWCSCCCCLNAWCAAQMTSSALKWSFSSEPEPI